MSAPETRFSVSPKLTVASVEHRRTYGTIGPEMHELKAWIDSKGIEQSWCPFCLYHDNPSETAEEDLRSEACILVSNAFYPEGMFQKKELPLGDVVETRHKSPPEQFAMTYGSFLKWLISNGYPILGPACEYCATVSDVKGLGAGFLIQQPIAKK